MAPGLSCPAPLQLQPCGAPQQSQAGECWPLQSWDVQKKEGAMLGAEGELPATQQLPSGNLRLGGGFPAAPPTPAAPHTALEPCYSTMALGLWGR